VLTKRALLNIVAVSLLGLLSVSSLFAQEVDIRGTVTDSSNGERIAYATVLIEGTSKGAASNTSGFYLIPNVIAGTYTLVVSCVGYLKRIEKVAVGFGEPLLVNIKLSPEPVQMSETVVTGKISRDVSDVQTSVHTLEPQDIRAVPVTAIPDILHAIQILPGIVSTSDVNSHFYVRGGGGDQNLIMLDGMKIYNPFHALGIFSIFDPDIVRNTEVYTGAFPPGYGGRLSSVVSLATKDGNTNQITGRGNLNFLSSKLQLEGPLGENFTWMADARKSFSNSTINRFLQKDLPVSFYDAFVKMTAKVTEDRQVRYGIQGFFTGDDLRSSSPTESNYSWRNHAIGFTASGLILGRVYVDAVAYQTAFDASRDSKSSTSVTPASTSIRETGLRSNATLYLDSKDLFYFGFEMSFPEIQYSLVNSYGILRQDDDQEVEGWLWLRYQATLCLWQIDGGIHLDAITLMKGGGTENIQPRINVSRSLFDNWKVRLSYGEFTQNFITVNNEDDVVSIFDTWIHIPPGLKPELAIHYVAGIDGNILPELSLNLQSYYKDYRSLVVYNRDKIDAFDPDYIEARGNSYGAELLMRYSVPFVDLYGAYSWSRTFITSQGSTYPPSYDRQHTVNLLAEFHILDNLEANVRWELGSGFPFTQSVGYYDRLSLTDFYLQPFVFESGTPYISLGAKNAARLPAYHRMDIGLNYRFRVFSIKGRAGVNIINVYDHQNIFYFDRATGQRVKMLPFFPTATLELEY
jgi:hypothetical protein